MRAQSKGLTLGADMFRTVSTFGTLASIMALSSLIYEGFQDGLEPLMHGLMGGILHTYQTLRDSLFAGIGIALAWVVNWIGNWFPWLPQLPRFTVPASVMDAALLYWLIGVAFSGSYSGVRYRYAELDDPKHKWKKGKINSWHFWMLMFVATPLHLMQALAWPYFGYLNYSWYLSKKPYTQEEIDEEYARGINSDKRVNIRAGYNRTRREQLNAIGNWIIRIISMLAGTVVFFFLVYAENRIGL